MQANKLINDPVHSPSHYLKAAITIEPIELTARLDSCLGQALQYVFRAPYKGNEREDLEKAIFYLKKEVEIFEHNPYVSVKVPLSAIPYIHVFRRHSSGTAFAVLDALFTLGYKDAVLNIDIKAIEEAIMAIATRLNILDEEQSSSDCISDSIGAPIEEDEQ